MSDSTPFSDTQPTSPFRELPGEGRRPPKLIDPDDSPRRRGGCGMMGVIIAVLMVFSLMIVALAGLAGWTTGQREAGIAATATLNAAISEQLARIPSDITSGNMVLLDTRIRYLATLGVPQANEIAPTATALFLSLQPTAAPTITPTMPVTPTAEPQNTEAPPREITPANDGGFDLAGIYQQAQTAFNAGQYQDAADYLDVIIGIDERFQTAEVRRLMSQALNARARELYNAAQPASANLVVDRARLYGALEGDLEYESYAATLYLNARGALGTDYASAINALREVINLGAGGRYYDDALGLLFQQYVAYGDAWGAQGAWCPAEQQYRNALNVLSSGSVNAKLQQAINFCTNGTPTPDPLLGQPGNGSSNAGGQPIAPIGQPGG